MEVILLQDTRNLGKRGEVVDVKPGYARNFLLPQGVALEANQGNMAFFEQQREKIDAAHSKALEEAQEMAAKINEIRITVSKRVGESGTLYGSVTTMDVVAALAEKDVTVEKRQIDLGAISLKTLGEHPVKIDLHAEVDAEVIVEIVPAD
ncbi:MAG: 50S ribosomal protein L9 [Thermoanaerobaculia bacterium]|nr:50S ribosomal protein L9 [Thermoanaerobaculia bacterium]